MVALVVGVMDPPKVMSRPSPRVSVVGYQRACAMSPLFDQFPVAGL
jgi:hypothetical protein